MINKFLKISQLFAITFSMFSFSNIFAEELSLSDDQREELASDIRDLGKELEQKVENLFQERYEKSFQYKNSIAGATWAGSMIPTSNSISNMGYREFMQISANGSFTNSIDILTPGSSVFFNQLSCIYREYLPTFKNELIKGAKILLVHEHVNLKIGTTPNINIHTKISTRDMKCYVEFDQLYNVASFSGESITNSKTVDLTKFTEFGLDRADFLKKCKRVKMVVNPFSEPVNRPDRPVQLDDPLINIMITGV